MRAAPTRRGEISFGPPAVSPMRSTMSEVAVWPAIDATEYTATPMRGTTLVCIATNEPPSAPANNRQRGISPFLTALRSRDKPAFTAGLKSAYKVMKKSPEENETSAACGALSRRWESSPLARA